MIIENYKTIFIHIPKTAGGTVELRLGRYLYQDLWIKKRKSLMSYNGKWGQHFTCEEYIKEIGINFSDFYSFCFVRNPWDRAVSEYFYIKKMKGCFCDEKNIPSSFEEYVKGGFLCSWEAHTTPQIDFITDSQENIIVDDIYKFEDFEKGFKSAVDCMGLDPSYEFKKTKANVSRKPMEKKEKPYWKFYDRETRDIIAEKYRKDIAIFNYDFID